MIAKMRTYFCIISVGMFIVILLINCSGRILAAKEFNTARTRLLLREGGADDHNTERRRRATNTPPIVTSPSSMKITGRGIFDITLFAQDTQNDPVEFLLDDSKPRPKYGNVTLSAEGLLSYVARTNDTGEDQVHFIVRETSSSNSPMPLSTSSVITLHLTDRDAKASIKPLEKAQIPTTAPPTLTTWQIAAIIAGGALLLTLVIIGLTCCCCTFDPGSGRLPKVSPFGNHNTPQERRPSVMNPHYKPPRSSLLKRESVRCGAADGVPYYGTRKSNLWTPRPDDEHTPMKRDSFVLTPAPSLQSEMFLTSPRRSSVQSELFVTPPTRRQSIQTITESPRSSIHTISEQPIRESTPVQTPQKLFHETPQKTAVSNRPPETTVPDLSNRRRSLSDNMSVFSQVPWSSISAPNAL